MRKLDIKFEHRFGVEIPKIDRPYHVRMLECKQLN